MYTDTVKVRVYIEGVLCPYVKRISVTEYENGVRAEIELPPSRHLFPERLAGAVVWIFYANSRVLSRFGNSNWPILFNGEIMGQVTNNAVSSESLILTCVSSSRHFEQTQLYFYDPQSQQTNGAISATTLAYFIGNTSIELDTSGLLSAKSQITSTLSEYLKDPKMKTESGRNIAYSVLMRGIMQSARERVPLFKYFDDKLRLVNRFAIYADPDVAKIITLTQIASLIDRQSSSLPAFSSLMDVLQIGTDIMQYNWNQIAQPNFRGEQALSRFLDDELDYIDDRLNAVESQQIAAGTVDRESEINAQFSSDVFDYKQVDDKIDQLKRDLESANNKNAISKEQYRELVKREVSKGMSVDAAFDIIADQGYVPIKKAVANPDSPSQVAKGNAKSASEQDVEIAKYQSELNEFLLTPNMKFSSPPKCNVFFPSSFMTFGINQNYMEEITRLISQVQVTPPAGGEPVVEWYIAPQSQAYHFISSANVHNYSKSYAETLNNFATVPEEAKQQSTAQGKAKALRDEKPSKAVGLWLSDIQKAKKFLSKRFPDVEKIEDEYVLAILQQESHGNVNAHMEMIKDKDGYNEIKKYKKRKWFNNKWNLVGFGTSTIIGGFQGSCRWRNKYVYPVLKDKKYNWYRYIKRIRNNRYNQCVDFLASMLNGANLHYFRPDLMSITHSRCSEGRSPGGTYGCLLDGTKTQGLFSQFTPQQMEQIKSGAAVTGDTSRALAFSVNWKQWNTPKDHALMYDYAGSVHNNYKNWIESNGKKYDPSKFVVSWNQKLPSVNPGNTVHGAQKKKIKTSKNPTPKSQAPAGLPFTSGRWVTPEEMRKNIISRVYNISDWYLTLLNTDTQTKQDEKTIGDLIGDLAPSQLLSKEKGIATIKSAADQLATQSLGTLRSDLLTDQRRIYIQSMVEAEFWRQRYGSRGVPPVTGPFNPYPVAGFPGLIMNATRPILGYVQSVTHNIDVAAASGTTSISLSFPRYWNEGDPWHWIGGREVKNNKDGENLNRRFPQWLNHIVVPTNNSSKDSKLDTYYKYMIGVDGIRYVSNNSSKDVSPEKVRKAIAERNPGDFEVNPETLEILEYNENIAALDKAGKFRPGTLAFSVYGNVMPSSELLPKMDVSDQISYNERYGVRENTFIVKFLKNRVVKISGKTVVVGPTFGSSEKNINSIQQMMLNYMTELESRILINEW